MRIRIDMIDEKITNYESAVKYIEDIPKFTKKHPLSHTKRLLSELKVNEKDMKIIHVAGTNGKGSVCAMLSNILVKGGKRTGLFTSPHLVKHNERIKIDNSDIDDTEFLKIFLKVKDIVDKMEKEGYTHPSYFEFLFLMAMYEFSIQGVRYVILETGLGGRLDATNSVKKPIVSIITQVGLDHMEYLGDTVSLIAGEKAGIIRKDVPVVYWAEDKTVADVISKKADENCGKKCPVCKENYKIVIKNDKSIDFSVMNGYYLNCTFSVPFISEYQVQNAMLVLNALSLIDREIADDIDLIKEGLSTVKWEGRMEMIGNGVILDGAHNGPGIDEFIKTFNEYTCAGEKKILFSVVKDKDYDDMVKKLSNTDVSMVYITQIDSNRALSIDKIEKDFKDNDCRADIKLVENVSDALHVALMEKKEDDVLFCVGSLYLIGEIKKAVINGRVKL